MSQKLLRLSLYLLFFLYLSYVLVDLYAYCIKPIFELGFGFTFRSNQYNPEDFSLLIKIFAILKIITTSIFIVGLLYLLRIVNHFFRKDYISFEIENSFRGAGKLMFTASLIFIISSISLNLLLFFSSNNQWEFTFHPDFLSIFPIASLPAELILMSFGLFCMFLSKAFNTANILKNEHDLTI